MTHVLDVNAGDVLIDEKGNRLVVAIDANGYRYVMVKGEKSFLVGNMHRDGTLRGLTRVDK